MNNEFDEIVVGGKSNGDFMSRMEEEYNKIKQMEMEEENKPLEERVKSKNWKTRKDAYVEILNQLKEEKCFQKFEKIYSQILEDTHPNAQETSLEIVKYLLENYENVSQLIPDLFKLTLEKCYTSTRSNLKQKAKEILVLSVEVSMESKSLSEIIKEGIEQKNVKFQQASINILTHLISLFGSFKIEYRAILSVIEKISDSLCSTPAIRTELIELYKELYKWIRDSLKNHITKFKENLQKDLEKAFEEIKANPKFVPPQPTKFLKSDKDKINSQMEKHDEIKSKMLIIQEEAKLFKNTEAVELFQGKYNQDWVEDILAKERKWIEKKEMLEKFINDSNVLKINNSSKAHVVGCFLKLLKDNNINVVNFTVCAINNLAKGLRKDFIESREFLIPLIEKFKEKKEKVVSDVFICLDSIMTHCLAIDEIVDDMNTYIKSDKTDKTTQIKERFCVFIEKTITKSYITVLRKVAKSLAEMMFILSEDSSPDVRNAALKTIGVIKFRVGEMLISKVLNDISEIKKKKVDEAAKNVVIDPIYDKDDKAGGIVNKKAGNTTNVISNSNQNFDNPFKNKPQLTSKLTSTNSADVEMTDMTMTNTNIVASKNPPATRKNNFEKDDVEMTEESNTINPNSNNIKPPMQRSQSVNITKPANANKTQNKPSSSNPTNNTATNIEADIEVEEDNNLSNDEIETIVKEKIGSEICSMFNESKWESRKNAFVSLANYVSNNPEEANRLIDILLRFIKIKLKDYKENNFNILKEAINVIILFCELCNNFQKKHCVILIKKFGEKLGDNKLKQNVLNMFFKFMEYHGPKYITNILLKHMTNNVKSPNVLKEFSSFLEKTIEDFGVGILPIKEIVEFGKNLAANSNPQLRNSATTLFCEIYKYLGANIKKFLKDVKEATLKVIEAEFEKITVVSPTANADNLKRELKGNACLELQNSGNMNMLDTLFPKIDISKKINAKLIKDLNEGKWQVKKEALESLEKIFQDANMRIMPNGLNEVVTSLKNKLDDGNKNMVRIMIQFITKMVEALGKDCKTFSKTLIVPILKNLSDKMNLLREDAIKCIEKWSEIIGFENILQYCPQFLSIDNFELRTDLLKLIIKYKQTLNKFDTKELIPGVISCLMDKTPSIRNLAEDLAKEMLKIININNFYIAMKDFKPAIANTIKGIIEKYSSLICVEPSSDSVINKEMNTLSIGNINPGFKIPNEVNLNHVNIAMNETNESMTNNNHNANNQHQRSFSANISNTNKQNAAANNNINKPSNVNNQNQMKNNLKAKRESNSSREGNSKEKEKKTKIGVNQTNSNNNSSNLFKNPINVKPIDVDSIIQENSLKTIPSTTSSLLINANIKFNQKNKRLENEKKLNFPNHFITVDYDNSLKSTLLNFFSKSQVESLYSFEVTKINSFFVLANASMKSDPILLYEVTDILLKWILIRNIEMNNNLFFNNTIFEFFKNLLQFLNENECRLLEIENKLMIEILISKIFTINPNNKLKSKQFFSDFSTAKIFKFETILEMLISKINSIYDIDMKQELLELLINLSRIFNHELEDMNRMKLLVNLFENVVEDNLRQKVFELIKNIYDKLLVNEACDNSSNVTQINEILKKNRETGKLIAVKSLTNNNTQNSNKLDNSNKVDFPIDTNYLSHHHNNSNNTGIQPLINFSKSPIHSVIKKYDESSSTDPIHIKLIDTFDQNKVNSMLSCLISSTTSINEKIKNLLELSDIFTNKLNEHVILIENNIDTILRSFREMLQEIFSTTESLNRNDHIELLKYILTVYYKLAITKDIIENCNIDTVYRTYEEILRCILYEGLESIGEQEEGKKIIKSLNALVLKFLENFNTTFTLVALIKLIQQYCGDNSRICSLSIKCLLKLTNIMPSIISNIDIEKIFIAIFEFTFEFEKTHPELNTQSQNEEMCLKILRTIIHEIIKIKNEGIWNYYKAAIESNNLPDKYVKRWIQLIMRSKNGISLPSSNMSNLISSSPMVNNVLSMKTGMSSNILNYSSNPYIQCSGFNQNFSNSKNQVTHGYINNNLSNDSENELNFYLDKLRKSNTANNSTEASNEKLHCEIIAILKRNNIPLEYIKEQISESYYNTLTRIYITVTNDRTIDVNSPSYLQNKNILPSNVNILVNSNQLETGQKTSDFTMMEEKVRLFLI